jgi:hypothetical protein
MSQFSSVKNDVEKHKTLPVFIDKTLMTSIGEERWGRAGSDGREVATCGSGDDWKPLTYCIVKIKPPTHSSRDPETDYTTADKATPGDRRWLVCLLGLEDWSGKLVWRG